MTADDTPPPDMSLARFLDGETEPEDGHALALALGRNPRFAADLRRLLVLDAMLCQALDPDPHSFTDAVETRLTSDDDVDRFTDSLSRRLSPVPAASARRRWFPRSVAACVAAAVLLGWVIRPAGSNPDLSSHAPTLPSAPSPAPVAAVLVNEAGARFAAGAGPDGGRFAPGEHHLLAGVVHLRFASGAEVVVRSPARFTVVDGLNMALAAGTLRAIVPDSAHGFTVRAAGVQYVDRGTEFGVAVEGQSGESRLHVFEGRVDLQTRDGQPLSSAEVGQSFRVVGGRVEQTGAMPVTQFPVPGSIGLDRWQRWREPFQKDAGLVCYYPFVPEAADPAVLKDHAAGGESLDGRIEGARWVTGRWAGKQALLFDRDGDHVRAAIPGSFRQLTLSAWVHLDRRDYELNAIFDSDGWQPGALHWQVKRGGDGTLNLWGKAQRRQAGPRVPLGQWVHLAAVADLDRFGTQVYVDGELNEEVRLAGTPSSLTPGTVRLGDWLPEPGHAYVPRRGFRGRIDEFAVWKRALTRDEVRELFVAGRPAPSPGE